MYGLGTLLVGVFLILQNFPKSYQMLTSLALFHCVGGVGGSGGLNFGACGGGRA